ncbi:MAG: hypothetical protein KAU62_15770 [Candidatus Heimdallarchaeota archaeon]|nr:hypothetical protein [Candidatus Heimdallarchaeota archaeon]MCK4612614.1 hypothetical protein [Candidatus Heimdallarchaeota archaeon]
MPHVRMSRNLNQSIFALIVGTIFSVLLIPVFGMNVLILAIFEIPLAFLVALIAVTECLYQYKDEVSMETTLNMIVPLLKSLGISIPVVLFYGAITIILNETIPAFEQALLPLFTQYQGLPSLVTIYLINFIPIFVMMFALPFFLYIYGKVHVLFFTDKEDRKARVTKADMEEKELDKKVFQMIDKLENYAFQLQQYLLEMQGLPNQIAAVDDHESFKALSMRLNMVKDYVKALDIADDKTTKKILSEEEVKMKLNEVEMQKKTVIDIVEQNLKKLHKDKKRFEKEEEEDIEEVEEPEEIKLPDEVEEAEEPEIVQEPKKSKPEEPEEEPKPEEPKSEEPKPEEPESEKPESETESETAEEELQDPSEIIQDD